MFYTYAEKQTSTIFGHWETRLVVFDTFRRYLYYSDPIPTKITSRSSQANLLSLSVSANQSHATSNTETQEHEAFTSVRPSRNTSTINRSAGANTISSSSGLTTNNNNSNNNNNNNNASSEVNTEHSELHTNTHHNNNNNSNSNNNSHINRPTSTPHVVSVTEHSQRANVNDDSHLRHDQEHNEQDTHHMNHEEHVPNRELSHSQRSNVSRSQSTLLQPIGPESVLSTLHHPNHIQSTPEPSHSLINESCELDISTLR